MVAAALNWGRTIRTASDTRVLHRLEQAAPETWAGTSSTLFHGLGRSYGDVAVNEAGRLCFAHQRDNILEFDPTSGWVRAQSGVTIEALNRLTIPNGWIIPVSPGTQFVTLGGAVANDVHGKNHHQEGSLGAHIRCFRLVRSNGDAFICSRHAHDDLFRATISGLGLTGFIDWVELDLYPIKSSNMQVETERFANLDGFFEFSEASMVWPYTVAWVDCFAPEHALGRGVFSRARFLDDGGLNVGAKRGPARIPFDLPSFVLNKTSIKAFNAVYRRRWGAQSSRTLSYLAFLYPLDHLRDWNRLYGARGFYQHQSIIPKESAQKGVRALLKEIGASKQGSFLAVLKAHGPETSPGLNTFSLEGVSLALDFPNRGASTRTLLRHLDDIVVRYGGRIYPAKDALMSSAVFQNGYPNWRDLERARDPKINSSFWRRVTQNKGDEA